MLPLFPHENTHGTARAYQQFMANTPARYGVGMLFFVVHPLLFISLLVNVGRHVTEANTRDDVVRTFSTPVVTYARSTSSTTASTVSSKG